jgi:hypothetical protein
MYRGSTRVCVHSLDLQYNNFLYVFFIVKERPLYVNFSIPFAENEFFSQCSTLLVGMRFWKHVSNSLRNKNMERHIPFLLFKMVILAFKTLLSPLDTREKNFFVNFERYDLANGEE